MILRLTRQSLSQGQAKVSVLVEGPADRLACSLAAMHLLALGLVSLALAHVVLAAVAEDGCGRGRVKVWV